MGSELLGNWRKIYCDKVRSAGFFPGAGALLFAGDGMAALNLIVDQHTRAEG